MIRTETDARLVARARQGDVEAFNRLISRWEKRVYNYLLGLLRNREDSLDICQETFLKAYRSLGTLEDAGKFPPWLFRIARNQALSLLRGSFPDRAEPWTDQDPEDALANGGSSPSPLGLAGLTSGMELKLAVARALDALPPEQREAVVLKVYYGFRFDEIAAILACPVGTVKSRIYAALARLKETLTAAPPARKLSEPQL